jgi:hypothetical protein
MEHRNEHSVARLAELASGMRPAEELYELHGEPQPMVNLADSDAGTQASLCILDHLTKPRGSTRRRRQSGLGLLSVLWFDHYERMTRR